MEGYDPEWDPNPNGDSGLMQTKKRYIGSKNNQLLHNGI